MMIDKLSALVDVAEDFFGLASNALLGTAIDLLEGGRYLGGGANEPMYLYIIVTEGHGGGAAASTIDFHLRTGTAVAAGDISAGAANVGVSTGALLRARLTKGAEFAVPLPPPETGAYKRYIQLGVTDSGTVLTAGQAKAYIVNEVPRRVAYPDAVK